ncbi:MAG: nitroreductase family protein [Thiovulaceae bacterium]|nr:nitroreductase family protein [Sulfurimonadaceae bacterium]
MDHSLQKVFAYHETTKHASQRYAKSLGYMDWAHQPDPFRRYEGSKEILLPLACEDTTPPYAALFDDSLPPATLSTATVAQLLRFSLALAAIKSNGYESWALRCNASSGNLHPSEGYLILPPLPNISTQTTLTHYAPKNHTLEILAECTTPLWNDLPKGSFFLAFSSVVYREVWKYGERAFRYTQLDAGHAMRAVTISAKMLGWHVRIVRSLEDEQLSRLLGFDQKERFHPMENEIADMLLLITPDPIEAIPDLSPLLGSLPTQYESRANSVATAYQNWPLIKETIEATSGNFSHMPSVLPTPLARNVTTESGKIVLWRRSVQAMDANDTRITLEEFRTLLESTRGSFEGLPSSVHLILFIHDVAELPQGAYIFIRDALTCQELQKNLSSEFLWEEKLPSLYLLRLGDMRTFAKNVSCSQDIASQGAFSLGMLAPFAQELLACGTHRYRELYWECGAIGQQLYLEATSQGLSGTGIGCFLDDVMHDFLGLKSNLYQVLYHFTVGRGLRDTRILTKKPYEERDSLGM